MNRSGKHADLTYFFKNLTHFLKKANTFGSIITKAHSGILFYVNEYFLKNYVYYFQTKELW